MAVEHRIRRIDLLFQIGRKRLRRHPLADFFTCGGQIVQVVCVQGV